jgi:hypothetical protein
MAQLTLTHPSHPHIDGEYPTTSIHHKAVRHMVVELFAATKDKIKEKIAAAGAEGVPCITLMLDIWEDKKSNRKFLGACGMDA